ncbi:hypothetical protein SDC9_65327 [bioreactor metagenome]|uniref:Phenylacetate--CoA ligase n=1 Tax=bioreactor metagenome TaxID=1076179 RepID=A0A644XS60_9ZZZZ
MNLIHRNFIHNYDFVKKYELASPVFQTKINEKKFIQLIEHVKSNVPYYKQLNEIENIRSIEDIKNLPLLTKEIIRNNFEQLKATNINNERFIKNSTSGSSGKSLYFYSDKFNSYSLAVGLRGDEMAGWKLGEKKLIIWGAERDINKGIKSILKRIFQKEVVLSSYYLDDKNIIEYHSYIEQYKPKIIVGYPSALFKIAQIFEEKGLTFSFHIRGVVSAGETLYDFQRESIEKIFNTKVFNRYGCREVGHIANECTMHEGLHYNSDHLIIELLDKNGDSCKPGDIGEIVITDLDNYVFPLIRYKIGDMGEYLHFKQYCKCGSTLPLIKSIKGRNFEVIEGLNGNRVSGTFWTILMRYQIKGIDQFQLVQTNKETIIFNIVVNSDFTETEKSKLIEKTQEKLGSNMLVEISVVEEIKPGINGKFSWIISEIKKQ